MPFSTSAMLQWEVEGEDEQEAKPIAVKQEGKGATGDYIVATINTD